MTWQPAAIRFPDAELLVTTGLRALLVAQGETDVHVGRKVPDAADYKGRPQDYPKRIVAVTRDGGNASELRDRPRLRVRVWDTTDQKVNDLARLVVALMPTLPDVLKVVHESGPYEVADDSKKPQRYCLFEVHTRGEDL